MPEEKPAPKVPPMPAHEHRKATEEEPVNADITHEVIRRHAEQELRRPSSALAWSGLAAGLSMGFSFVAEGVLHAHLPDAPWRPLVSKFGYSVGFLIVILGSQQLFTENTLTPVVELLAQRTRAVLRNVLRLWGVVLAANVLGTIVFGVVLARTDVVAPHVHEALGRIGQAALGHEPATTLLRAIFAGWLIALMVWMLPAARSARFLVIVLITYLVGVAQLSHIIAGAAEVVYVVASGGASWGDFLTRFFVPTLLGNIIGGTALVAALNHAQVVAGGGRAGA